MSRLGNKGGANPPPKSSADGNILQVGIGGRKTPRGGSGLSEGGVQALGCRTNERWQSVHVGGLQLGELAVIENHARDGKILGESLENVDGGRDGASPSVLDGLGQV